MDVAVGFRDHVTRQDTVRKLSELSNHPLNLALRFVLEVLAISALAFWGWSQGGFWRWPLAIGLPVIAMVIWALTQVPEGPGREGGAIPVPGPVRLLIELALFGLAILALLTAHANDRAQLFAAILAAGVAINYALSWDRIHRLLTGERL